MKIDFLACHNRYNTALHFTQQLMLALSKKGVQTRLHWIDQSNFREVLRTIQKDPPDCTCSFSNILVNNTQRLGDFLKIPHLSLLLDAAPFFMTHFEGKFSWVSSVDQESCSFIRNLPFAPVFFLPHAAEKELATPPNHSPRPYPFSFFGSLIDLKTHEERWRVHDKNIQGLLHTIIEQVLSPSGLSIYQVLQSYNIPHKFQIPLYLDVEPVIRARDRIRLINALKDYEVHVWGEGPWAQHCPHAICHPAASFTTTLDLMKQSQIVLNSSPFFKRGSHERLFYAPLCGAALLTGETPLILDFFQSKEVFTYQHGIYQLPENLSNWAEVAHAGQQKVLLNHTWDHRAQTILDFLSPMLDDKVHS